MDTNARPDLPWDALGRTKGAIPWEALEQLARAAVAEEQVLEDLLELFDQSSETYEERQSYECLYIPAILALAAEDFSPAARARAADFLVQAMVRVASQGDDCLADQLPAAIGALGPEAVLPAVLKHMPADFGLWDVTLGLWQLAELASETRDASLREQVVALCTEALRRAESGLVGLHDVEPAAWTLAVIGEEASRPLLQRLLAKTGSSEIRDSIAIMDDEADSPPQDEPWARPVREWLTEEWKHAREDYGEDYAGPPGDEYDSAAEQRARQLAQEFAESPPPAGVSEEVWENAGSVAMMLLDHAWTYASERPEELTRAGLREVLLDVFARKMTAGREFFEGVGPLAAAFLDWLQTRGILADAAPLRDAVLDWSDEIVSRGMDRQNWGPGKRFAMAARERGCDLSDRGAMLRFMAEYNQRLSAPGRYEPEAPSEPVPVPIVNQQPKVGRNDPCPCGSGTKHKKCCGG